MEARAYDRAAVLALLDDLLDELRSDSNPERWDNKSLDDYLEALRAWLADSDGYFYNLGRDVPDNAWEVIWHALHAAPSYE
jgi:hypothetical protein